MENNIPVSGDCGCAEVSVVVAELSASFGDGSISVVDEEKSSRETSINIGGDSGRGTGSLKDDAWKSEDVIS